MPNMSLSSYRKLLVGKLYKILPLWELRSSDGISSESYWKYLNSLIKEIIGALDTYPELCEDGGYISVVNTLNYMKSHEVTHEECRSEVFKMIGQIELSEKGLIY